MPTIDVHDGRERVGFLKPLRAGGFEALLLSANAEIYIGEGGSNEGVAVLVQKRLANDEYAPTGASSLRTA